MPQMHPLMWTLLLSFSIICLIFIASILFFSLTKSSKNTSAIASLETKNLTWKW